MISAVSVGMVFVLIRKIGTREHPMVIINYFMVIAMLVGGIFMIPFWKTPVGNDWYFFISLGIIGFFGQVFMTKAFQLEDASRVGPIKYAEAIFALIIGWIWLDDTYTFFSLAGIGLIMAGMFLNVLVKK